MNACMVAAAVVVSSTLAVSSALGQSMYREEIDAQNKTFQKLWSVDFNWTFDELPTSAKVAQDRIPYSGYIYPDTHGGTVSALQKYDRAFKRGGRATAFERRDTSMTELTTRRVTYSRRVGFRGIQTFTRLESYYAVPYWYGHCNGWTSATIRHAEPQKSVKRNGVVFTPSDIKGLLAEIYIYNDNEMLAEGYINPGKLHAIIANWLGRGTHPIGMEADPGTEKWNYPIYGYSVNAYNRSLGHVDIQMTVTYANSSETETDKSPRLSREKYFNYHLNLDGEGKIVGGYYYRNSDRIDMLWIPLRPKAGGEKGNERGNPHVDIDEVLAIWRDSVPAERRASWAHVDPTVDDRLDSSVQLAHLRPTQQIVTASALAASEDDSSDVTMLVRSGSEVTGAVETAAAELPVEHLSPDELAMP